MLPILIDCDPGYDDAIALMLAFGSKLVDVLGVTTVAGNGTVHDTHRNAGNLLNFMGRSDVPLGKGADKPLLRRLNTAPQVHGKTALDGFCFPKPAMNNEFSAISAIDLMTQVFSAGKATIVALGPLTNVAIFLLAKPELKTEIEQIVLMGGCAGFGNITPSAEFNMYVDPEAAKIVFEAGIPVTMIGLDVTHQALIYPDEIASFKALGKVGQMAAVLMEAYSTFYRSKGFSGNPIHDAVAVAHLLAADLVHTKEARVEIETRGELTSGRTVVDFSLQKPANCSVGLSIHREKFIHLIKDAARALA